MGRDTAAANSDYYVKPFNLLDPVNGFLAAVDRQWAAGPELLHLLTSNIPASSRELCEKGLKIDVLAEIYKGSGQLGPLPRGLDLAWEKNLQQRFLGRLRYPGIDDRKAEICDPYGTTCRWIFEPSVDAESSGAGFRNWLSSSRPLFWITGKPGSGKSTLAKHIVNSVEYSILQSTDSARAVSRTWNVASKANIASFFFSALGRPIQRSTAGLLRSLLFQILRQDPGVIPIVAPSRWEALQLFEEDPKPLDQVELRDMLVSVLGQHQEKSPTFLVIDGLDECEDRGNNLEMLNLVRILTTCPGVKVCVTSRSLPQFSDIIDKTPSLTLEKCTKRDIENFITSSIDPQLLNILATGIGLDVKEKLVRELTARASGVFLWASIVLKSLQEKLTNGDASIDLLHYVNNIPSGLSELYASIFDRLNRSTPFVASILHFIALAPEPVSLLRLSFMEMSFPEFALAMEISPVSPEVLDAQSQNCRERVVFRSMGLLEVRWPERQHIVGKETTSGCNALVSFVHYSVKEFFEVAAASSLSTEGLGGNLDIAARYCAASLSILKISPAGGLAVHSISAEVVRCASAAILAREENEDDAIRILEDLEYTYRFLVEGYGSTTSCTDMAQWTACNAPCMHQVPIWELMPWSMSDLTLLLGDKKSTKLRQRAVSLCWRYGSAGKGEEYGEMDQWLGYQDDFHLGSPMSTEGGPTRVCCGTSPDESTAKLRGWSDMPLAEDAGLCATDITEGVSVASPENEVAIPPAQFEDRSSGVIPFPSAVEEYGGGNADPDDDDENLSWESLSSAGLSLDEDHPLMGFEAEVTQAVFQGFLQYRQKLLGSQSKGF